MTYCHKLLLSLKSDYFKRVFSSDSSESEDKIHVPDMSSDTMAKLIQFLYTGELDDTKIDIDLLSAANKFQSKDLQSVCELELSKTITMDNASKIAVAADIYGTIDFRKCVFRFVAKHWKEMKQHGRHELLENNAALLCQILDST